MNMIELAELLAPERCLLLEAEDKKTLLEQLAEVLSRSVPSLDCRELMEVLLAREAIMSTGIGLGIAVPHARLKSVERPILAVGVSGKGVSYESLDDKPVHIVVMIVVPAESQKQYLRILARVTLLLKNSKLRSRLLEAKDPEEIYEIFSEY